MISTGSRLRGQWTRVLCEQIRTVDAQRTGGLGTLSAAELLGVEDALEIVLICRTRNAAAVLMLRSGSSAS